MAKLTWDDSGKRLYETGVEKGVLYPIQTGGVYTKGVAWNGLTGVTESPSGAEANPIYADNIKYLNLISTEQFGAKIEAYTYPEEFAACDGSLDIGTGVSIGQQKRVMFGLSYKTAIGNDIDGAEHGYKLHLIYGAMATPSERAYATVNDKPDAITFSWDVTTTPVSVTGFKPTASLTIDSTKVDPTKLAALELILYGNTGVDPRLPLPDEITSIITGTSISAVTVSSVPANAATAVSVNSDVVLTFNNKIAKESVVLMVSATGAVVSINKTFDATGKILTVHPTSALTAATKYLVAIVGVADIYNQTLATTVNTFTTA
jgi:hypothetical protein